MVTHNGQADDFDKVKAGIVFDDINWYRYRYRYCNKNCAKVRIRWLKSGEKIKSIFRRGFPVKYVFSLY
jgi:hypothetical protein